MRLYRSIFLLKSGFESHSNFFLPHYQHSSAQVLINYIIKKRNHEKVSENRDSSTIDGRQGGVRESLEEKTMNLAKAVAELISSNLRNGDGSPVECVIADSTIGRVAESAACADKFEREGVGSTITVTSCWCYGAETMDMNLIIRKQSGDSTEQNVRVLYIWQPYWQDTHKKVFLHSASTDMTFRIWMIIQFRKMLR